jgi:hypothetical protein
MAKRDLSLEMRNALIWLERQPEVTSVVQGRYVRSRHRHTPGFTRVVATDKKSVHLRTFDKGGSREIFVYAPPTPLRDRWVAALASGDVLDGTGPKLADNVKQVTPTGQLQPTISVPTPKPLNDRAGQTYNVSPELAAKWLERNTRNRDLRTDIVQRYAGDMKAGRWLITGDAIAFDKNGAVVNGQHRLWAVFESGCTVPMLVTFNLEPDVVRVLDDHLKRKLIDVEKISRPGSTVTSKITAAARVMQVASISLTAVDKRAAVARLSRQQQLEFLEKHSDALSFAVRECFKSASSRGLSTATIMGVVARAYYSQDHERLKSFAKVLVSGLPDDATADVGALLLRNFLQKATAASMRPAAEVVYRKTERAVLAFCRREKLKNLYESGVELFFLPEDKPPARMKAEAEKV